MQELYILLTFLFMEHYIYDNSDPSFSEAVLKAWRESTRSAFITPFSTISAEEPKKKWGEYYCKIKFQKTERKTEMKKFIVIIRGEGRAQSEFDTKGEALEYAKDLCGIRGAKVTVYERSCTVKPKNEVDVVEG